MTLAVFAAACIAASFMPNQYTATTTMYVLTRNVGYNLQQLSETDPQQQPTTDAAPVTSSDLSYSGMISDEVTALMNSDRARQAVAERLGLPNLAGYTIVNATSGNSRIIKIAVTGPNPQTAADVANTMVEVASDIAVTIMNVEAVNTIDQAVPPAVPSGPNRKRYALMGLLAGFVGAIFLVRVADMLDTRVRNGEDLEDIVDVPVIGHFPLANADEGGVNNAAKTLLANIRFMGVDNPLRTIAVTSAAPDEGKTFVALHLAQAIATSGKTVLLIEGDMRRRSMAETIGVRATSGVYAVMTGELGMRDAIVPTPTPNLYFLDCEASIPTPSDLLNSQSYTRLIAYAKAMFDYVVFDTPPIGAFVDSAVLGSKVDAILVVVRENYTRKPDVQMAIDQLGKAGSNIAGIVMNFCETGSGGYYSYYYYGYYYGRDGKTRRKGGLFRRNRAVPAPQSAGASNIGGLRGWLDGREAKRTEDALSRGMYVPQVSEQYAPRQYGQSGAASIPQIPMGSPRATVAAGASGAPRTTVAAATAAPPTPPDTTIAAIAAAAGHGPVAQPAPVIPVSAPATAAPAYSTPTSPQPESAPTEPSRPSGAQDPSGITTDFANLAEQIEQAQAQRAAQPQRGRHSQSQQVVDQLATVDGDAEEF